VYGKIFSRAIFCASLKQNFTKSIKRAMVCKKTVLSNGLTVVTDSIDSVQTTSLGMWVKVGTRHETKAQNGISHLLEHMAFKGTKTRTAQQIAEEVENVGGYLNAYTSRETTAYYARVLGHDTALATDIVADILQNSTFDAGEFEKEQSVVIQEIGQANDTPDDIIFDHFQNTCFPNHPMGWPTLGTAEVVQSLTPSMVQNYMNSLYGAQQMVFSAAGCVEHGEIVALAEKHFQKLPKDCAATVLPAQYVGGDYREQKDLEQVHVILGFEGLPYEHPHYYTLSVLSTLFGGGMSSRLFQEIREKRGLVYSIYSYASSYADTGIFGIYAGTGPDEVGELIPVVCEQITTLGATVKEAELARAKAQLKAGMLMGLESTSNRCERLANQYLLYGRHIPTEETIQKINAVSLEDIQVLCQNLFRGKPTLTALGPVQHVASYSKVCDLLTC
jgi:predicted Zn-dependent peptidase